MMLVLDATRLPYFEALFNEHGKDFSNPYRYIDKYVLYRQILRSFTIRSVSELFGRPSNWIRGKAGVQVGIPAFAVGLNLEEKQGVISGLPFLTRI